MSPWKWDSAWRKLFHIVFEMFLVETLYFTPRLPLFQDGEFFREKICLKDLNERFELQYQNEKAGERKGKSLFEFMWKPRTVTGISSHFKHLGLYIVMADFANGCHSAVCLLPFENGKFYS